MSFMLSNQGYTVHFNCMFSSNWLFLVWLAALKLEDPAVSHNVQVLKHFMDENRVEIWKRAVKSSAAHKN